MMKLASFGWIGFSMDFVISNIVRTHLKWLLAVLFLLSPVALAETAPTWTQAASFGGAGSDEGNTVKVDNLGNRYVTGWFSSTASFGNRTLVSAGGTDMFLAKYGSTGQLLWLLQAGGTGDDVGWDLDLDGVGNIYVAGRFTGSATFHSANGAPHAVTGSGWTIFLAKYSPSGELAWAQTATGDSTGNNEGSGVAVEPRAGTVYMTGRSQGPTTFSSSDGSVHTIPGPGTWHAFLAKYDSGGHFQWAQWNEAQPNSVAKKVAVDADSNAYVAGWLQNTTTFHSNDGQNLTVPPGHGPVSDGYPTDEFLVKYDRDGNAKWVKHREDLRGKGIDVAVSPDGRISITGLVWTVASGTEVFIETYDGAGALIKQTIFGGAQDQQGSGSAYDQEGNLYVVGVFQRAIDIEGHALTGDRPLNLFVVKYMTTGEVAWVKKADGAGAEATEVNPHVSVGSTGAVVVTGGYRATALFDAITLQSAGTEDIFLAELSCEGDCSQPPASDYQFQSIAAPANWHDLAAMSINNNGVILVTYKGGAGNSQTRSGLLYPKGLLPIQLPKPNDGWVVGRCVNNNSEIGGTFFQTGYQTRGFLRSSTGLIHAYDVTGALIQGGGCINDLEHRTGGVRDKINTGLFRGYLLDNSGHLKLLQYPGSAGGDAEGINNADQVVGSYYTQASAGAPVKIHGFLYDKGQYTSIDVPGATETHCRGMNNKGAIIGSYVDPAFPNTTRGFLLQGGVFQSLDFGLDPVTTLSLEPLGINDKGEIVGVYRLKSSNQSFGFLATPVK